jgi:glycosyltransferase involved in cell wall biosynthesis
MLQADVVLLYTDQEVELMRRQHHSQQPILATSNALSTKDIDQIMPKWNPQSLRAFREQANVTDKLLLFCGRLRSRPSTELEVALHALRRLTAVDDRYRLAVIGSGDDMARLQRIGSELGIAPHVHWLGDIYDEESLAPWFLSACCLVYPGAIGLTLLHAFAYGLPVVTHSSRLLHNPEIAALIDNENGLLFARGDVEDLCAKLRLICDDPERAGRLSASAYRTIRERYSMDGMIERFRSAITEAAARSLAKTAMVGG